MKLNERVEAWFGMLQANGNFDLLAGRPAALSKESYRKGFVEGLRVALQEMKDNTSSWNATVAIRAHAEEDTKE